MNSFEEQFPDCLEFVSRSMRAGHAFSVAIEMAYREFSDPLAGELRRAFEEQNLGQPLEIVLRKLSERVPSMDVQFFVSAVLLQKRTGGNLAEVLDKLAQLIRERFKLRGAHPRGERAGAHVGTHPVGHSGLRGGDHVRGQSAICALLHRRSGGTEMLAAALGMQLLGYLIIRKIVTFEV